jgi:hypothetical protein
VSDVDGAEMQRNDSGGLHISQATNAASSKHKWRVKALLAMAMVY